MTRPLPITGAFVFGLWLFLASSTTAQPTIEDFMQEPEYRQAAVSPSGDYLAEVWNIAENDVRAVTVRDLTRPEWPVIGKIADNIRRPSSVSWANEERLLISVLVPSRTESVVRASQRDDFDIHDYFMNRRTIAMDVDAGNVVILLDDDRRLRGTANLSRVRHYMPQDPDHVLMSAWREDRLVLYKVNVYSGESELLVHGRQRTFAFLSDEAGNPLYRLDFRPFRRHLEIFELHDKNKWRRVEIIRLDEYQEEFGLGDADFVGVSGEKLVYRRRPDDGEFHELIQFDPDSGSIETIAREADREILYPLVSRRSDGIVGYALDGDVVRHRYFDEAAQQRYDLIADRFDKYFFSLVSASTDFSRAVVSVRGQSDPGSYYLFESAEGTLRFLRHRYPQLSVDRLSRAARVSYKARDGQIIQAYALFPGNLERGERKPLVVLPHGGPQARDRADYSDFAQFISTRGYIVIRPNFRGSTGYGRSFEEAGYKQWGQLMQDDVADAVDYLVRQELADPERVCIVGGSYGGYVALMAAIKNAGLYRCAVSINGVAHLPDQISHDKGLLDDDDLLDKYVYQRIGHPKTDRAMLEANSPSLLAERMDIPVLVIAGKKDRIVDYRQSRNLVKKLKKLGKPHRFVLIDDAGHNVLRYVKYAREVYAEVERFLAEHLAHLNLSKQPVSTGKKSQ